MNVSTNQQDLCFRAMQQPSKRSVHQQAFRSNVDNSCNNEGSCSLLLRAKMLIYFDMCMVRFMLPGASISTKLTNPLHPYLDVVYMKYLLSVCTVCTRSMASSDFQCIWKGLRRYFVNNSKETIRCSKQ